jgi:hypothetical protein
MYYSAAWFDRWLKGDRYATTRLLARTIDGRPLSDVLSARFRSAASYSGVDCGDLRAGCR